MKKHVNLIFVGSFLFLVSCKPVYECGQEKSPKIQGSKRFKAVVVERDKLCDNLASMTQNRDSLDAALTDKKQKLADLNTKHLTLNKNHEDLQSRHNKLMNDNLSQAEQYSAALKAKSDELNEKEKVIREREQALREMQQMIARKDSLTKRLNDVVRNALLGFNSDELSVEVKNGKVYVSMSDKLLFKSGSANIETKGQQAIQLLADVLNKNLDIDVAVEGHTDNIPIRTALYRDNWDLSVARATTIVRMLTADYKVSPLRVTASGKGEFYPRAANDTAEGRALNRRTEIVLSPKLDELMKLLNMD
jgi:chemotaxis protein MotB